MKAAVRVHDHGHPDDHRHLARWPVYAVVAVGGAVGALSRFAASKSWPNNAETFPLPTLLINTGACLLMGVLTVVLKEVLSNAPKLLHPLIGTGFLGGFSTFSSYVDDTRRLLTGPSPELGVINFVATVVLALAAVALGIVGTRAVARRTGR